jgi:hypothetical protein
MQHVRLLANRNTKQATATGGKGCDSCGWGGELWELCKPRQLQSK